MKMCSEYNRLAWKIRRKYGVPLKWAMKSAYCLKKMGMDNPLRWMTKASSPLSETWDSANTMKLINVLRALSDKATKISRRNTLDSTADRIYRRYLDNKPIGCTYVADLMDGELVYWVTKYYVESYFGVINGWREESKYILIDFPDGECYTTFWFDRPGS